MTGHGKGNANHMLDEYLTEWSDREMQLARLHEEIISKREALLSCSVAYHQSQEQRHKQGSYSSDEAYLRNHKLIKDIRSAQEKLYDALNTTPSPRFMTLQKNYWAMVRSQVSMWEEDLGMQRSRPNSSRSKSRSPDRRSQPRHKSPKKHRKSQQKK